MYGVVLWSDKDQNRAVIWCEDHGDLAFYGGETDVPPSQTFMEPGDLVQFQVEEARNMRFARNVSLVSSEQYPTLAQDLKEAGQDDRIPNSAAPSRDSKIVAFGPRRDVRESAPAGRRSAG